MARIAYILLCHKDPDDVIAQAERLTAAGDFMAIHFDARAPAADFARIRAALKDNPRVTFARRRVRCGWGEWSLVQATLNATIAAEAAFPGATHFYLLSGDCMPIKPAHYVHAWLDEHEADFVESFDFFDSGWIKTGLREDRLIYRHPFNERTRKWLFYRWYELQKRMGWKRPIPPELQMMIGSQWWCLRRRTIEAVLAFCAARPDILRWFRTTWIPDETFFQTLVRHLVPAPELQSRTLTFLMFTDYGMPVNFYNDQYDLLVAQDYLFARKISPGARGLKARLGALYTDDAATLPPLSTEGRKLHQFLTGRGREGRRFAPRFWEAEASIGRGRTLFVLACKKWHVAKRLAEALRGQTGLPVIDYLFSEEATRLPDLGGAERTLAKRNRHRRSLLRRLFDHSGGDRLAICVDPAEFELIRDLYADEAEVRLLLIDCAFSDTYLSGHARRVGLAGQGTTDETMAALLPTVRFDVTFERDRILGAGLPHVFQMAETAAAEVNAAAIAEFLGLPVDQARPLADTPHLFTD